MKAGRIPWFSIGRWPFLWVLDKKPAGMLGMTGRWFLMMGPNRNCCHEWPDRFLSARAMLPLRE